MFCFQSAEQNTATQPQQTALIDCLDNLRPGYCMVLCMCVCVEVMGVGWADGAVSFTFRLCLTSIDFTKGTLLLYFVLPTSAVFSCNTFEPLVYHFKYVVLFDQLSKNNHFR